MTIGSILGAIIIGAIIGALGRLVLPGRQPIPIWLTIVVGIVAALIGTFIVGPMRNTNGIDWVELIVQVALAVSGLSLITVLGQAAAIVVVVAVLASMTLLPALLGCCGNRIERPPDAQATMIRASRLFVSSDLA